METLRVTVCAGLIGLLLGACGWSARTSSDQTQKNGENAELAKKSAVVESEQSNKTITQEKLYQTVAIANLADGNYRFCTKPSTYKAPSGLDVKGWCFIFRKTGSRAIGVYTYWAPSDYTRICINGTAKGNTVSGNGYVDVQGGAEPITSEDIKSFPGRIVWDDWFEEGNNLQVGSPSLHSTGKYSGNGEYYAWKLYESVQLDLNGFYQRDLVDGQGNPYKLIPPQKCPNDDFGS